MKSHALLVLSVFFFFSFAGRIAVLAAGISTTSATRDSVSGGTPNALIDFDVNKELADSIRTRINALDAKEIRLLERTSEINSLEIQINKRLEELQIINDNLQSTLIIIQSAQDEDIAKVAQIYENMKPQQAAIILSEMDPNFAAGLLRAINSEQAAKIVAALDSQKAYAVSVIMANQSTTP